jgi:7-keto-8-aminopelargonate synthetase-like enzyme
MKIITSVIIWMGIVFSHVLSQLPVHDASQLPVEGMRPDMKSRKVIVVSGNFSIDGQLVNIAQYDIAKKE